MPRRAACRRSESVSRVVVKSPAAVYGAGPRAPAAFTEDMAAAGQPRGAYARDAVEVDGSVRGFMQRLRAIAVTIRRLSSLR